MARSPGVGLIAFSIVLLRQPHAILRPQFVWEEAGAIWAATCAVGLATLLREIIPWIRDEMEAGRL